MKILLLIIAIIFALIWSFAALVSVAFYVDEKIHTNDKGNHLIMAIFGAFCLINAVMYWILVFSL